jgi:hypothetical protein
MVGCQYLQLYVFLYRVMLTDHIPNYKRSCRGRDRMVVGFTTTYIQSVLITTKVVSSDPAQGGVYLIQHYVIKFVGDLWEVGGFSTNFLHQ